MTLTYQSIPLNTSLESSSNPITWITSYVSSLTIRVNEMSGWYLFLVSWRGRMDGRYTVGKDFPRYSITSTKTPRPKTAHRPNFIELLTQKSMHINCLLSRNEQDTSHKLYLWHDILASNLILVSIIFMCLARGLEINLNVLLRKYMYNVLLSQKLHYFSEGAGSHNVLYFRQLFIACYQLSFYAYN